MALAFDAIASGSERNQSINHSHSSHSHSHSRSQPLTDSYDKIALKIGNQTAGGCIG
jgi:hypothetical protein